MDDLTDGEQFRNLADADIADYLDQNDFLERYARGDFGTVARCSTRAPAPAPWKAMAAT